MRVVVRSAALALAIMVIPLASAAAHECFVVNRSDTGNAHASGSGVWVTVTLHQLYETTEEVGLPDLTPAQVDYATTLAASLGVPDSFTIRSDKTLLENASGWQKGDHAADGKGIDHFVDVYGDQLFAALFAALQNA
jgi:NADPH:quinone reductase-like Zn-dependent oxidoreductase